MQIGLHAAVVAALLASFAAVLATSIFERRIRNRPDCYRRATDWRI